MRTVTLTLIFLSALSMLAAAGPSPRNYAPRQWAEAELLRSLQVAAVQVELGEYGAGLLRRDAQRIRERDRAQGRRPLRPASTALRELVASWDSFAGLPLLPEKQAVLGPADRAAMRHVTAMQLAILRGERHGLRRETPVDPNANLLARAYLGVLPKGSDVEELFRLGISSKDETQELLRLRQHLPLRLEQVFQVFDTTTRRKLVATLAVMPGADSQRILARRAVFDPAPAVRLAAIDELTTLPRERARAVFLDAMRHPWPPAADHAARALVALGDHAALPRLRDLARMPAPSEPFRDDADRWHKRELVAIDHNRNCLLCHAPALDESTLPYPDAATQGADPLVVLMRQDFSVLHTASGRDGPTRVDYVVRERTLTDEERRAHLIRRADGEADSPQARAARWAVRQLAAGER
jgi:hypothetical protein